MYATLLYLRIVGGGDDCFRFVWIYRGQNLYFELKYMKK